MGFNSLHYVQLAAGPWAFYRRPTLVLIHVISFFPTGQKLWLSTVGKLALIISGVEGFVLAPDGMSV